MQHSPLAKRAWWLLIVAASAIYFYGLGHAPLLGPDEPRYAQVAREMFARADPVTPTLGGHTWFEKPALLYWAMMASYSLFGVSEWSARFGSACAGLLTALFVGWMALRAERAGGPELRGLGLAATTAILSTISIMVFARGASFDIILTAAVTISLACFFMADLETKEKSRRWLLVGFYAGMGLALLAKGLIGIIIPAGVVAVYYLLRHAWPDLRRTGVWWGALVALAVAALWYAPVIQRHGWLFIDEFFLQHHFARYTSNKYRHPQPFYFFLPVIALLALPWTIFLGGALVKARHWRWRAEDAASRMRVFACAWLAMPVVFFSFSGSKLPGYVLPAVPGAILLASEPLARYARGEGRALLMRLTGVVALLLAGVGLVYAARNEALGLPLALALSVPAVLAGLFALVAPEKMRAQVIAVFAGAVFVTIALLLTFAFDKAAQPQSVRDLLRAAEARGYAETPVFNLHTIQRTAEFYAAGRLAYDAEGEPLKLESLLEVEAAARRRGGTVLVFVPPEHLAQLAGDTRWQTEIIGDNRRVALVAVRVR